MDGRECYPPVTRYAESALKAQSQTQRWCPCSTLSNLKSKLADTDQIFTVVSAEQVARYLKIRVRISREQHVG